MARTAITVQVIDPAGLSATYASGDATNDHEFANDGKTFLHVKNTGGSAVNVTINTQLNCSQGYSHDEGGSVPATTGDEMFGPFAVNRFNDANGNVLVDLDTDSGITLRAFRLPT